MKTLPNKHDLDMMWTVATSGSLETGTRPHYGFAEMLYDYFTDTPPQVSPKQTDVPFKIRYNYSKP